MLWGEVPAAARSATAGKATVAWLRTVVLAAGLALAMPVLAGGKLAAEVAPPQWKPAAPADNTPRPGWRPAALVQVVPEFTGLRVLSDDDANRYRRIFDLQKKGDWPAADREIAWLDNRVLMGHVRYQRYMHPRAYRSRYDELRDWLEDHGDHPGARRVYRLALKRKPAAAAAPPRPQRVAVVSPGAGEAAPRRSRKAARQAAVDWSKGLGAWRRGDYGQALRRFAAVADNRHATVWTAAGGGFWAARAALASGAHAEVMRYLASAAAHPLTFYGLVAARLLGHAIEAGWAEPPLNEGTAQRLKAIPALRRAIALAEAEQHRLADREFGAVAAGAEPALVEDLLVAAGRLNLAPTSIRLSKLAPFADAPLARLAAFPLPHWRPEGGFELDRALIYAVIRQESEFRTRAKSPAGARGLMQLMPRTASYVARDRSLRRDRRDRLYEPALNMALGQKYLQRLSGDPDVGGDLIRLAVAYNGGPGNLRKWLRQVDHGGDALLFIETIPAPETRNFVERVLANLWIYRMRLGQETPSLDQVAVGAWPRYVALDEASAATVPVPVRLTLE